jgi:hypothetical protein
MQAIHCQGMLDGLAETDDKAWLVMHIWDLPESSSSSRCSSYLLVSVASFFSLCASSQIIW